MPVITPAQNGVQVIKPDSPAGKTVTEPGTQGPAGPRGSPGAKGDKGDQGEPGQGGPELGWIFVQDISYTALNPLLISAGSRTVIPDNATGPGSLRDFGGVDSPSWFDPSTSKVHAIKLGEFYIYRLNVRVVPYLNNKSFVFDFDIGTPNTPWATTVQLSRGAGVATQLSFDIPYGVGQGMLNNGGTFNITPECDCGIFGVSLLIKRSYKP